MKYIPLVVIALAAIFFAFSLKNHTANTPSPQIGKPLPEIALPRLFGGEMQPINKVVVNAPIVIHFFASWCAQCVADHTTMMELKNKYQVRLVGVAWKNKPEDVTKWLKIHGNPYDAVLLDESGKTTVPFGLSGIPETFVVNKEGVIALHYSSVITPELREKILLEVK